MFCHNCGTTLEVGTAFCGNCGAKQIIASATAGTVAAEGQTTDEPNQQVEKVKDFFKK